MPILLTVAVAVLLLLQLPPGVVLLSIALLPMQSELLPLIAAGAACTVTVILLLQPVDGQVNVTTPGASAVTTPLTEPTVATAGALLLHVPATEAV